MKKIIYSIVFCSLLFTVSSCKKTDGPVNPLSSINNFKIGSYLVLDKTISENLDYSKIATATVGVTVHQYSGGEAIDHVDVFASTSFDYDTTKWKMVKTVPYTGTGISITVTGTELAKAYGVSTTALTPGSSYTIFNRIITKSGARYDVNTTNDNGGGGLLDGPYYNGSFHFAANVVCPYVSSMAGTYKVITDDWQDNAAGDIVTITDGPKANTLDLSGVWPNTSAPLVNHLIINIDPATGAATVPKVTFEDDGKYGTAIATDGAGYAFSCTGKITLTINVTLSNPAYGDQGAFRLILQKQ
jgi:hypothetical protein